MKPVRTLIFLGLSLGLAACGDPVAATRARLQPLVGQKESVLIATMGVPRRALTTGGVTYLTFDRQRLVTIPGPPPFPPPYGPGWASGLAWTGPRGYYPQQQIVQSCEAVFAVVNDVVTNFTVRGDGC